MEDELDRIEDEDRRSRGLDDNEIRNEKILEIMQDSSLDEKQKMEKCMWLAGHDDYTHKETEEDAARREQQELLNKVQDPRYQARDKMHFLQEAYNKYGGAEGFQQAKQTSEEEKKAKVSELQEQMAAAMAAGGAV